MLRQSALVFIALLTVSGCTPQIPKEALQWSQESPALARQQSRRFQTRDEQKLLSAGAGILQDMGFTVDTREPQLGVIASSKKQSLDSVGEKATSIAVGLITGVAGFPYGMPVSKDELVTASLITKPGESNKDTVVRLTLQRVVWDNRDKISTSALLKQPELYQEFFAKLSKAVSLEAHEF